MRVLLLYAAQLHCSRISLVTLRTPFLKVDQITKTVFFFFFISSITRIWYAADASSRPRVVYKIVADVPHRPHLHVYIMHCSPCSIIYICICDIAISTTNLSSIMLYVSCTVLCSLGSGDHSALNVHHPPIGACA